ncbi:hypothetical protein [Aliirhizobium smilacinae]|uniref:Uncharacterized protein n=1 Tax=Aliirhizobium smilacinae TaxID=1395944 RepID=A0A5C4XHA8_9HYPH|nr:hypothetical protein [Rhizobium smilacinae]TNM62742.1 hypothetical protein FHP24_16080 [Rhizobium smilacinae]
MIRKLIISAAVLAALIHGKEASAAGPGGFARELASIFVNRAEVDHAISEVDAYLDTFVVDEAKPVARQDCVDCIDI